MMSYKQSISLHRSEISAGSLVSGSYFMKTRISFIVFFLIQQITSIWMTELSAQNTVETIIDDMTLAPDAPLHGTEGLSWGTGEASPQPIACPAKNFKGEWFQAMTDWGQVYIPREGSLATNTRCQIRNVISKILCTDGTWKQVQSGNPTGAAFVENYANNASIDAGIRDESTNGGGISVIVGIGRWSGYNFHFWSSSGRAAIDTNNTIAVFTTCEARLIQDDTSKPDDRSICKNVFQMGGDWWLNLTVPWLPDWSANSGIACGRAKWVTSDWQSFNMCTLTPDQIRANPPVTPGGIPAGEELSSGPILVYPNPLQNDVLFIKAKYLPSRAKILIYSGYGKPVYEGEIDRDETVEIAKSVFISGLYLIKISGDGFLQSDKLVIE